jgi:hypothetical protein
MPHAERAVGLLRGRVVGLDVQPDAADVAGGGRAAKDVFVQRAIHAAAAERGVDVDRLDPEKPAVAPVAPLAREHQLAHDPPGGAVIDDRDDVVAALGIGEHGIDAAPQTLDVELFALGLVRHRAVEGDDGRGIVDAGVAQHERKGRVVAHAVWYRRRRASPKGLRDVVPPATQATSFRVQSTSMLRRMTAFCLVAAAALASPEGAARRSLADTTPPRIDHAPPSTCAVDVPCVVEARITDDSGVFDPALLFRAAGATTFERASMQPVPGDATLFRAVVPPALIAGGDVEYLVEAFDVQGNGPARAGTDAAPLRVRRAATSTTATATATSTTTTATSPDAAARAAVTGDDGGGLALGLVLGGVALAVLAVGGVAVAVYALRPTGPEVVNVTIAAPSPVPASLIAGAGR